MSALAVVAPRIGQLIKLLASDHDGEVVAAARALGRTLESVGEDFHSLAAAIERPAPATTRPEGDHRSMARWLLNSGARLNPREFSFLTGMSTRFGSLSERQSSWLQAIFERVSSERRRA
jgi:hypothetical protein